MARLDPHSFHDADQPQIAALEWRARVDLAARTIEAEALLRFSGAAAGAVDLDTRELAIRAVTDEHGAPLPHALDPPHPLWGARLRVERPAGAAVRVVYRTAPSSSALQWAPGFVYSQCQTIHARSLVPLQDTPRVRIRYRAALTVPVELQALMAAAFESREEVGAWATVRWTMEQPIPPYLMALAVGALQARELGPRSRVWAEPPLIERAAHEFAGVEAMVRAAEALFGPYPWERFDLLVMPSTFPFGGMENPRLAFVTPTLLVGDRSLVHVVVHELAHAWTGNLVTNASAEHFWLNEGFTVYAERRILEALEGAAAAALHAARGRRELMQTLAELGARPELTRLRLRLDGVHPDDALSTVAYEKGYLFLCALEAAIGRARFDGFLRAYLARHRFGSLTTEEWLAFAGEALPEALARVDARRWLDEPGLPEEALRAPETIPAQPRSPVEWQLYLGALARPLDPSRCAELDAQHGLTRSGNLEILAVWLALAVEAGYEPALARVEELVGAVGRIALLKPLYLALARRAETRARAGELFRRFRDRYHPIARRALETLLQQEQIATQEVNALSLGRARRPNPV